MESNKAAEELRNKIRGMSKLEEVSKMLAEIQKEEIKIATLELQIESEISEIQEEEQSLFKRLNDIEGQQAMIRKESAHYFEIKKNSSVGFSDLKKNADMSKYGKEFDKETLEAEYELSFFDNNFLITLKDDPLKPERHWENVLLKYLMGSKFSGKFSAQRCLSRLIQRSLIEYKTSESRFLLLKYMSRTHLEEPFREAFEKLLDSFCVQFKSNPILKVDLTKLEKTGSLSIRSSFSEEATKNKEKEALLANLAAVSGSGSHESLSRSNSSVSIFSSPSGSISTPQSPVFEVFEPEKDHDQAEDQLLKSTPLPPPPPGQKAQTVSNRPTLKQRPSILMGTYSGRGNKPDERYGRVENKLLKKSLSTASDLGRSDKLEKGASTRIIEYLISQERFREALDAREYFDSKAKVEKTQRAYDEAKFKDQLELAMKIREDLVNVQKYIGTFSDLTIQRWQEAPPEGHKTIKQMVEAAYTKYGLAKCLELEDVVEKPLENVARELGLHDALTLQLKAKEKIREFTERMEKEGVDVTIVEEERRRKEEEERWKKEAQDTLREKKKKIMEQKSQLTQIGVKMRASSVSSPSSSPKVVRKESSGTGTSTPTDSPVLSRRSTDSEEHSNS